MNVLDCLDNFDQNIKVYVSTKAFVPVIQGGSKSWACLAGLTIFTKDIAIFVVEGVSALINEDGINLEKAQIKVFLVIHFDLGRDFQIVTEIEPQSSLSSIIPTFQ